MASVLDTIFQWLPKLRRPDGGLADAACDGEGNLKVAIAVADASASAWVDPLPGSQLVASRVLANAPASLLRVIGSNEGNFSRWLMLFDATSPPTTGAPPVLSLPVPFGSSFDLLLPRSRAFSTGIVWSVSSTPDLLTADTSAKFRVHAELVGV